MARPESRRPSVRVAPALRARSRPAWNCTAATAVSPRASSVSASPSSDSASSDASPSPSASAAPMAKSACAAGSLPASFCVVASAITAAASSAEGATVASSASRRGVVGRRRQGGRDRLARQGSRPTRLRSRPRTARPRTRDGRASRDHKTARRPRASVRVAGFDVERRSASWRLRALRSRLPVEDGNEGLPPGRGGRGPCSLPIAGTSRPARRRPTSRSPSPHRPRPSPRARGSPTRRRSPTWDPRRRRASPCTTCWASRSSGRPIRPSARTARRSSVRSGRSRSVPRRR